MRQPLCRFCGTPLEHTFADLGVSPLSNAFLRVEDLDRAEPFYPLHARVCHACFLVQVGEFEPPERIFCDYAYFSSYSDGWLDHCRRYVDMACERFNLGPRSRVVEVASNDGYLLQYFAARGVPVLGVEPAANVAAVAVDKGIPTLTRFFGAGTAREMAASDGHADLLLGNNVLAHVPDLNDFVEGLRILLAPGGTITMEFPHLVRLIGGNQFDTIYHEHFSYFSFATSERVFARHGLDLFDVEELPTHGGSLRIYAAHRGTAPEPSERVLALRRGEETAGIGRLETYLGFGERVKQTKRNFLRFMIEAKEDGATIAGYGAPAKGNTLLNYCGIGTDFIEFTVDRNPEKQGRYLPGSRVPVFPPGKLREAQPDLVVILPWNLRQEIVREHAYVAEWGGRFVVPIPEVEVVS